MHILVNKIKDQSWQCVAGLKKKKKVIAFKKFEIQGYCYHLYKFHIFVLVYCICVRDRKRDTDV